MKKYWTLEYLLFTLAKSQREEEHSRNMQSRMSESCKLPSPSNCSNPAPPWEVLVLVTHYLDPKTLAMASCVCKSWSISMSSDHIWKPICFTHYPSLSSLSLTDPTVPYRRLYALAHQSIKRRHPCAPRISLDDLVFAVDIFDCSLRHLLLTNAGEDLNTYRHGVFRFEVDVQSGEVEALELSTEAVKVTWAVVLKGWRGVFSMMECKGKGRRVSVREQWFMEELPSPGCCLNSGASGLVAELGLGFCDGTRKTVEKVSLGIMNVGSCRYLSVDDGLRYLQYFLLPDLDKL